MYNNNSTWTDKYSKYKEGINIKIDLKYYRMCAHTQ